LTVTTPDLISFGHPLLLKDGSVAAQNFVSIIIALFFTENEVRAYIENLKFNIPYFSAFSHSSGLLPLPQPPSPLPFITGEYG
jgi:hypothetical protein